MPKKICHRCLYKIELFHEFKNIIAHSQETLQNKLSLDIEDNETSIFKDHAYFSEELSTKPNSSEQHSETTVLSEPSSNVNLIEGSTSIIYNNSNDLSDIHYNKGSTIYPNINIAEKNNQCLLCLKKCDKEYLQSHIENHVQGTNLTPYNLVKNSNLFCKPCNKYFRHRYTYLIHQREHLNIKPFVCRYGDCSCSFYSNSALKQHLPIHSEKNFICAKCGIGFKRKSDMRAHEIIHQDGGSTCPICGITCKNKITFSAHIRRHRTAPKLVYYYYLIYNIVILFFTYPVLFYCSIVFYFFRYKCIHCSKQFYCYSELTRHGLSHAKEKIFRCIKCSRSYYSQSALNRHFKIC